MAILVECTACHRTFRAKDQFRDMRVKCPRCQHALVIQGRRVRDHDVFISYSHKDKSVADAACASLESAQVRCWMAPRDIEPGRNWGEAIIDALEDSRVMILVFSSNANLSEQVLREVERAVSKGVPIIPFRIEDVGMSKNLEYFLSACHWLDAMTGPLDDHLRVLSRIVRELLVADNSRKRDAQDAKEKPPGIMTPAGEGQGSWVRRPWVRWAATGAACVVGAVVLMTVIAWLRKPAAPAPQQEAQAASVPRQQVKVAPASLDRPRAAMPAPEATLPRTSGDATTQPILAVPPPTQVAADEFRPPGQLEPLPPLPLFEEVAPTYVPMAEMELAAQRKDRLATLQNLTQYDLATILDRVSVKLDVAGLQGMPMSPFGPTPGGTPVSPFGAAPGGMPMPPFGAPGGMPMPPFGPTGIPVGGPPSRTGVPDGSVSSPKSAPARVALKLPDRFILNGLLAGVRVVRGQTYVGLTCAAPSPTAPTGARNRRGAAAPAPYPPTRAGAEGALIVFDGDTLANAMADFADGVQLSVVIRRDSTSAGATANANPSGQAFAPGDPYASLDPILMAECRRFLSPSILSIVAAQGAPGFSRLTSPDQALYWVQRGEALEKRHQPLTWTNPGTQILRKLANPDAVVRSPTQQVRNPGAVMGVEGRIRGQFLRLSASSPSGGVSVLRATIQVAIGSGKSMDVELDMGPNARPAEFADYEPGQLIDAGGRWADLVLAAPAGTWSSAAAAAEAQGAELYPLVSVTAARMACSWIQKADQDETRITASGLRRQTKGMDATKLTPEIVGAFRDLYLGQAIEWQGKLRQIRWMAANGQTHILLDVPARSTGSKTGYVEAFTDVSGFVDLLDEYETSIENASKPTVLLLKGTVARSEEAKFTLDPEAVLIRITQLQRADAAASTARPGETRSAATTPIAPLSQIAKLRRLVPTEGTELRFSARYSRFSESDGKIVLADPAKRNRANGRDTVSVVFAQATKADFADYVSEDLVEVVARMGPPPGASSREAELIGVSIVRPGNRLSLVTAKGRPEQARNFNVEQQRWNSRYSREKRGNETFTLVGRFDSAARGDDSVTLKLDNAFHTSLSAEIICEGSVDLLIRAFEQFKPGDELILVAEPVTATGFGRRYRLVSLARLDQPGTNLLPAQ